MSKSSAIAVIALSCLMAVTSAVAWAQIGDRDSCVDACQEAKAQCIDTCDSHDNPVECEEDCQDAAEDCIHRCR